MEKLMNQILNPDKEFTPIPFWFFNDSPEEEKIRTQLQDYVKKGVYGLVLHPRIGVPKEIPYLSEAYFQVVRFIVKTAEELDMKIVLYDEGMYPSGSAHGQVVASNPAFAARGVRLVKSQEDISQEDTVVTQFQNGDKLVYGFTHGTIRGIHFGEDDGEADAPAAADILNPKAVAKFIELTHERYYAELKPHFGHTIIAFFTDEPCALGRNAGAYREWLPNLEQEIREAGGTLEELKALFSREENDTTRIYHKLIKKYLRQNFYQQLSIWCQNHDIALMGHPEASDDVEEELYFQIPGQDLIMRRVAPESGGLLEFDSVQAKLPADIARHLGRKRNANECFGVCYQNQIPWYFEAKDMKWYLDWLGMRGVNLFVPHAFFYSVAGQRSGERPPDVGPNNIWWPYYEKFATYMKRLSFLMTDSINDAKVVVFCDNNQVPYREVACLYEQQIAFNYLPIALLADCKVKEGKLCIRDYAYDVVLVTAHQEWKNTLYEQVAHADELTVFEYAEQVLEQISREKSEDAENWLATVKTKNICKNLRVSGLKKQGISMYVFSNEGEKNIETEVTLPQRGNPVMLDLWTGEVKKCEAEKQRHTVSLPLILRKRQTMLVLLDEEGDYWNRLPIPKTEVLLGDWTEQFELVEKSENVARYAMDYQTEQYSKEDVIEVRGDEMIVCYCNGKFVDVSFWAPHRFAIGKFLQKGRNQLELEITGNAANLYQNAQIPFGLEKRDALFYAKASCETMMRTYKAADLPPKGHFHYHQGVFLSGVYQTYLQCGEEKYFQYVKDWVDSCVDEQGNIHTFDARQLDDIQPGILLFPLWERTKDARYKKALDTLLPIVLNFPRNAEGGLWHKEWYPEQMWLDGLYMAGPISVEYGKQFHLPQYQELAVEQALLMEKKTRDEKTGLWYHAWDYSHKEGWADEKTGLSPEFWGRSIGWVPIAVLDELELLPKEHTQYQALCELVKNLLEAVCRYQSHEGRWYQVVDKGEQEGNWLETSCSCLYVAAICHAVRMGILPECYLTQAKKGYEAVIRSLTWNGDDLLVGGVCVGTGVGDYRHYCERPTSVNDLHGVGAFLLMCTQYALTV